MATPSIIPIHCHPRSHSGPLDICKTTAPRSTEIEALYPKRLGVYNPREPRYIFEPPSYLGRDGLLHAMGWCRECAEWKHRESFYKDRTRANGLEPICRQCSNHARADRKRRQYWRERGMREAA